MFHDRLCGVHTPSTITVPNFAIFILLMVMHAAYLPNDKIMLDESNKVFYQLGAELSHCKQQILERSTTNTTPRTEHIDYP
jgi:hypothetical protein